MRRARTAATSTAALIATIAAEVALARRTPPDGWHEGFPHDALDGRVSSATGDGPALRLVWLGDSTGDGVGASAPERTMPRLVATGLGGPVHLTVLAVSGARAADVEVQASRLVDLRPDIVALGVGVNDVTHLTPRRRFGAQIDRILEAAKGAGATRIVVVGIPDMRMFRRLHQPLRAIAAARARALDAELRRVAGRHRAVFVDAGAAMRTVPPGERAAFFASDGFHPGDLGYRHLAAAAVESLAADSRGHV